MSNENNAASAPVHRLVGRFAAVDSYDIHVKVNNFYYSKKPKLGTLDNLIITVWADRFSLESVNGGSVVEEGQITTLLQIRDFLNYCYPPNSSIHGSARYEQGSCGEGTKGEKA